MSKEDLERELDKVREALELAYQYHSLTSEANAALHCSEKVMYSPLVSKLQHAIYTLEQLKGKL